MLEVAIYTRVPETFYEYTIGRSMNKNKIVDNTPVIRKLCEEYINKNHHKLISSYNELAPDSYKVKDRDELMYIFDRAKMGDYNAILVYDKNTLSSDSVKYNEIMERFKSLNLQLIIYEEELKSGRYDPNRVIFILDYKASKTLESEVKILYPPPIATKTVEEETVTIYVPGILDIKKCNVASKSNMVAIYAAKDINFGNDILRGIFSMDPAKEVNELYVFLKENGYEIFKVAIEYVDFKDFYNRPKLTQLIMKMNKHKVTLLCIPSFLNFCVNVKDGFNFFSYLSQNCSVIPFIYSIYKEDMLETLRKLKHMKPSKVEYNKGELDAIKIIGSTAQSLAFTMMKDKHVAWFGDNRIVFQTDKELYNILNNDKMKGYKKFKIYRLADLSLYAKFVSDSSIYDEKETIMMKLFNQS